MAVLELLKSVGKYCTIIMLLLPVATNVNFTYMLGECTKVIR